MTVKAVSKQQHNWMKQLEVFNETYIGRPTRLDVIEDGNGERDDLWIEDGLPFQGVDVDLRNDPPGLEMMLGQYTHNIDNVRRLELHFSLDGSDDGLNVTDHAGKTTILRFE
jgi:hypothetical protein